VHTSEKFLNLFSQYSEKQKSTEKNKKNKMGDEYFSMMCVIFIFDDGTLTVGKVGSSTSGSNHSINTHSLSMERAVLDNVRHSNKMSSAIVLRPLRRSYKTSCDI
jgi:hypothetical protein